ncbi:hypothetical protein ABZS29_03695 [Kribbella sp. NPDC005582]|uniref:hypothetical protein n=1 Tax=Kribbella sp. NPDC005582 TaxID=3156893 RepID=UPI0033BEE9C7
MSELRGAELGDASRRSNADHDLSHLYAAVVSARVAERLGRGARPPGGGVRSNGDRLMTALVAYEEALERYGLPVPPVIRDELRLRRALP